ncbi:MAG: MoaD/ThiS family protein [Phycisphaeraceae bacterium]
MPTQVTVKLFGPQAKLAGQEAVALTLDAAAPTCRDVRAALAEAQPALTASLPGSRLAVNHEYADDDQRVSADDEVALIGMIGGG